MATPSKADLVVDWATHEAALHAVQTWHYSQTIPKSKLVKVGAWECGRYIGCVIFGTGATRQLVTGYGLEADQGCELVRIALRDHQTPVSRIVRVALLFLRRQCPGIRLVVSFADPAQGHHGGIYQAGNWIYAGLTTVSAEYLYKGKRWHGRAFRKSFGNDGAKMPGVVKIMGTAKHRYLMPLDEAMRARIEPLRKQYPKRG